MFLHVFGLKLKNAMSNKKLIWDPKCVFAFAFLHGTTGSPTDGMAWASEQLQFVVYNKEKWCKQFKYFILVLLYIVAFSSYKKV